MTFQTQIPSPALSPYIRQYTIVESDGPIVNRLLPPASLTMAFRLRGTTAFQNENTLSSLPASVFSGLRKTPRLVSYDSHAATIIILFRETGAAAFFKQPLNELFEDSPALDNFIPRAKIAMIEERLMAAKNNEQIVSIINELLEKQLINSKPDLLVQAALSNIHAANGDIRIHELAKKLYISNDAFEKRFRKVVGASPKQFASIVRMNFLIQLKQQSQTLTHLAYNAGYFDQPHFNKDFKLFTGLTPRDFFQAPPAW